MKLSSAVLEDTSLRASSFCHVVIMQPRKILTCTCNNPTKVVCVPHKHSRPEGITITAGSSSSRHSSYFPVRRLIPVRPTTFSGSEFNLQVRPVPVVVWPNGHKPVLPSQTKCPKQQHCPSSRFPCGASQSTDTAVENLQNIFVNNQ